MEELKLIPEIRFPEFEEPLAALKLGDIAKFSKGKGISKADIVVDGEIECVRYGELYTHYNEIIEDVLSKTNLPLDELVLSEKNDVIIPASGETELDIATASCVLKSGIALSSDLNIIKSSANGVFLAYYLNNAKKLDIAKLSQGISVVHLYGSQLKTLKLNLPIIEEQQKIATFLTSIDERIQLLEKKKESLEDYKKGIMQKIFSQEIRFKDEDGNDYPEWEEKKLGDIGYFQTSSVNKLSNKDEKEVYLVNYMNVYRHEDINNISKKGFQIVTAKDSQIETSNLLKGDILFTPSSETPDDIGHSAVIFEDLDNTVFSYHLIRFRPVMKLNLLYSHYFCNIPSVARQLSRFATGSTRFTISLGNFSKVKIHIPHYNEQQKIASFLSSIDDSIEQVTQQIEHSKTYKKGLLQKMFV